MAAGRGGGGGRPQQGAAPQRCCYQGERQPRPAGSQHARAAAPAGGERACAGRGLSPPPACAGCRPRAAGRGGYGAPCRRGGTRRPAGPGPRREAASPRPRRRCLPAPSPPYSEAGPQTLLAPVEASCHAVPGPPLGPVGGQWPLSTVVGKLPGPRALADVGVSLTASAPPRGCCHPPRCLRVCPLLQRRAGGT